MSLEEIKARLLDTSEKTEDMFSLVHELYIKEINTEIKPLTKALSELHNSGQINFIEFVTSIENSLSGNKFFTLVNLFESLLPSLDISVEDALHCLVHLTMHNSRDLGTAGLYGAFEAFCSMEVNRPGKSVEYILAQSELNLYIPFLPSSILSYGATRQGEAVQALEHLITNSNQAIRNQVYFTLGKLATDNAHANAIWELIRCSAYSEHDNNCCISILRSMLLFGEKFPTYWAKIEEVLINFVDGTSPETLNAISHIVSFQRLNLPGNVLQFLVKQLGNVLPEHRVTINNIDHLLVNLVERGLLSIAIELLESMLTAGVEFQALDYFSSKILSEHQQLLNHITTKWFLSGNSSLCLGILDLLHSSGDQNIALKAETALINNNGKKIFVCHKAIGWLFTRPIEAATFILSICETTSSPTIEEFESILYDPLLLSYPGELKSYFESCIDENIQVDLCGRLINKLKTYLADMEKVSNLKELMAPSANISAYWRDINKDMQKAHEEASKNSIMGMFTTRKLLYGNSSTYYMHQADGTALRQEMQMHSFSHSTAIPRLDVLDPVSLDYTLRIYRCEVMKNEVNS